MKLQCLKQERASSTFLRNITIRVSFRLAKEVVRDLCYKPTAIDTRDSGLMERSMVEESTMIRL